jgi:putative transposase
LAKEIILLTCVRWSVASPVSDRPVEELMQVRRVAVDHATVNRWVLTDRPPLEEACHRRERPVSLSWRTDETSIRVTGPWRDVDRAPDNSGQTREVLRTEHRRESAARRCLAKAIRRHGVPETSTIDGTETHAATRQFDRLVAS